MLKKLLYGLLAVTALSHSPASAQLSDSTHWGCGVSADYFLSKGVNMIPNATAGLTPVISFPATAVKVCGPFTLYYEDLRIAALPGGVAAGFADPIVGVTCQNTLCSVLTYVASVFDFSKVTSSSGTIRLFIDTSYSATGTRVPLTGKAITSWGYGASYYDGSITSGIVDGFVHDYITTGVDHNPGDYHGTIKMNFDRCDAWPGSFIAARHNVDFLDWSIFNYGLGTTTNCQADLYYRLLHLVGHVLGMASYHDGLHGAHSMPTVSSLYTSYETAVTAATTPAGAVMAGWVNTNGTPDNYPTSLGDSYHLGERDYARSMRVSPGDYMPIVMGDAYDWGVMKRQFSKADLLTFKNQVGLSFDPVTFAGSSSSAALVNNHLPYSDRMASMAYSTVFDLASAAERLPADYTIPNNTGASIMIDLTTMTGTGGDLHDADGDPITIMDGSLVNLRGCGSGGNNHNLLTVNPAKNAITFTPRPNFYGRTQFGLNLWDGKEKGAYVIFTIDVQKGTAVSIPTGSNIVLNGDFEEGSEVRLLGNSVDNATNGFSITNKGRLNHGQHFADSHPYDCYTNTNSGITLGNAIRGSFQECQTVDAGFGHPYNSFPWTGGAIAMSNPGTLPAAPDVSPDAYFPAGVTQNDRYMILGPNGSLLYLGTDLQQCKVYQMEFDIRHRLGPTEHTYTPTTPIAIGFTDNSHIVDPATLAAPGSDPKLSLLTYNQMLPVHATSGVSSTAWKHETLYFTYCASAPSNVLYFACTSSQTGDALELIDNISIKEVTSIPLTVAVTATPLPSCQTTLSAGDIVNGCTSQTYSWNVKGSGTVLATTRDYTFANTNATTTYQVTVFDGCHSAVGEYTVEPCPCSPGAVFKATATTLSGTISTPLSAGYYYIPANVTIAGSPTFTGANILIEPGVTITVANNALLTLNGCHLFTCPDTNKLWNGIVLASGTTTSGRIVLSNNTLIEDAVIAINATNPKTPASGNIIDASNTIFNRNTKGVYIENYMPFTGGTYPFSFVRTVFTSRQFNTSGSGYPASWPSAFSLVSYAANGTLPPYYIDANYTKINPKNGGFIEAGIRVKAIGNLSGTTYSEMVIGGGIDSTTANLFDNVCTGIYAENANLSCYNNIFINLQPGPTTPPLATKYYGAGIHTNSDATVRNRLRVQYLPLTNGAGINKFFDCATGINTNTNYETDISACRISSSNTASSIKASSGINVSTSSSIPYKTVNVSYNDISNIVTGIWVHVDSAVATATTTITYNGLADVNPWLPSGTSSTGQSMNAGIKVESSYKISNTTLQAYVDYNVLSNVYNGIIASTMSFAKAHIDSNNITLREIASHAAQYGISVTSCYKANVSANIISADPGSNIPNSDKVRGVYAVGNTNLYVCSNNTNYIGRGFDFAQYSDQHGTRWVLNHINGGNKGFVLGSNIGDQGYMDDAVTWPFHFWGAGQNTWTGFAPGKFQTYTENGILPNLSILYIRTSPSTENPTINSTSATLKSYPNIYEVAHGSLIYAQRVANCDGVLYPNHYNPLIVPASLGMHLLKNDLGYGLSYNPNQWMGQLSVYQSVLQEPSLRDSFYLIDTFMNAVAGGRYEWVSNMERALASGDAITAQSLLSAPALGLGTVNVSNNITITDWPDADYVVADYTDYFGAYLHYLQGTYSSSDSIALYNLTTLCPAVDGVVVYEARSLYSMITGTTVVYDDDDCLYGTPGSTYRITKNLGGNNAQAYTLYPSPNNGDFSIRQSSVTDRQVRIKVYNTIGAVIYQSNANFMQGTVQVHLGQQAAGVYLVCIDDGSSQTTCLRFVIK